MKKRKVNEFRNIKRDIIISGIILGVFLIILGSYYLIFYPKECSDSTCFQDAKENCKRVYWVREDTQSWGYTILGGNNGDCKIQVQLIESKEGSLDATKLQGEEMICLVSKGDTLAPEKDLSRCTGILKESIQEIMIQRMHNYILENLGEIKEEFI